jgi:nitrite reductase/ring-hydroxylating ferredoxin subunit
VKVDLLPIPDGLTASGTDHMTFEDVAAVDELPVGTMRRVTRGDVDLLLVRTVEGLCATDDRCPHMAAPLSVGTLDGCELACPLHRGHFDLRSGAVTQFPTTGGLDADGAYHAPWSPAENPGRPEPTDIKARARASTRVRRLRYYPVRVSGARIEVVFPR